MDLWSHRIQWTCFANAALGLATLWEQPLLVKLPCRCSKPFKFSNHAKPVKIFARHEAWLYKMFSVQIWSPCLADFPGSGSSKGRRSAAGAAYLQEALIHSCPILFALHMLTDARVRLVLVGDGRSQSKPVVNLWVFATSLDRRRWTTATHQPWGKTLYTSLMFGNTTWSSGLWHCIRKPLRGSIGGALSTAILRIGVGGSLALLSEAFVWCSMHLSSWSRCTVSFDFIWLCWEMVGHLHDNYSILRKVTHREHPQS